MIHCYVRKCHATGSEEKSTHFINIYDRIKEKYNPSFQRNGKIVVRNNDHNYKKSFKKSEKCNHSLKEIKH